MASLNQIPPKRNLYTFISAATALLVALLALGALLLSYNALRGVAVAYGLAGWQSYIWPLLLDFALVVFSLAVVRNALLREKTLWPWTLVGLYTAATIAFNILHAPATPVARVVAVVAPLSLFLSFETLMAQLKSEVHRHSAVQSLASLSKQVDNKIKTLDALERQLAAAERRLETLKLDIKSVKKPRNMPSPDDLMQAKNDKKDARINAILTYLEANPDSTITEAGKAIGVSRQTASLYINGLTNSGRLRKNGQGWEVR